MRSPIPHKENLDRAERKSQPCFYRAPPLVMSVPLLPSIDHFPALNSQSPEELNHLERSTKKIKNLHHEGYLLESAAPMDTQETLVS